MEELPEKPRSVARMAAGVTSSSTVAVNDSWSLKVGTGSGKALRTLNDVAAVGSASCGEISSRKRNDALLEFFTNMPLARFGRMKPRLSGARVDAALDVL